MHLIRTVRRWVYLFLAHACMRKPRNDKLQGPPIVTAMQSHMLARCSTWGMDAFFCSVSLSVAVRDVSMAVPSNSESPCAVCASPSDSSAPFTCECTALPHQASRPVCTALPRESRAQPTDAARQHANRQHGQRLSGSTLQHRLQASELTCCSLLVMRARVKRLAARLLTRSAHNLSGGAHSIPPAKEDGTRLAEGRGETWTG